MYTHIYIYIYIYIHMLYIYIYIYIILVGFPFSDPPFGDGDIFRSSSLSASHVHGLSLF